jgi:ATP-dependent helicase/nuclease subunit B
VLQQARAHLQIMAAHPARSVVLLPYAQLLPLAARFWGQLYPDGFAPHFETTHSWAARLGDFEPGPSDLSFERGRDWLTAAALLEGAGLGRLRDALVAPLLEYAWPLADMAASVPAHLRPDWAERARGVLPAAGDGALGLDGALARIALAWASASDYACDVLFDPVADTALDALVIVPGLQADALTAHLAERHAEKCAVLALEAPPLPPRAAPHIALHCASDAEDEATRAAACVLRHLNAGCAPVALVAQDRALARRISALLQARQVPLCDETGWLLSTTHAAAQLMAALRACAHSAGSEAMLDWLKLSPAWADHPALAQLEKDWRHHGARQWAHALRVAQLRDATRPLAEQAQHLREAMQAARALPEWLEATRVLLEGCGLWAALMADAAGQAVLAALGLARGAPAGDGAPADWPGASRRQSLPEFTHWVTQALEAASFRPPRAQDAQVHLLPMSQLMGRSFAALVLPGADEVRLSAAPDLPGPFSPAQRQALYMPGREALRAAQDSAWAHALAAPQVDVLWRCHDEGGQELLPSPLVQMLQLAGQGVAAADPRDARPVPARATSAPAPNAAAVGHAHLSASGYQSLRRCPYQYFALRLLGLRADDELDRDPDARDWGNWVHAVLEHFHGQLQHQGDADRAALLDAAAQHVTQDMAQNRGLQEAALLPYTAAWPQLRDAYLHWLAEHEKNGAHFVAAEQALQAQLGLWQLRGRADRVDRLADGTALIVDYKTESLQKTKNRVKPEQEDVQLPFYVLLAQADASSAANTPAPQAAYLNLAGAGSDGVSLHACADLPERASQLRAGIQSDMARIAAGAPMRALGEGPGCDWCAARGLCRKDFWSAP